jgi:hypothetical protein
MRIAKPMLAVLTPLGVIGGVYEGYRLAGGLVAIMVALIAFMTVALMYVVRRIRQERAELERERALIAASPPSDKTPPPTR